MVPYRMEKHSDERRTDLWGNPDNFVGAMRHFMASMLTPSLQVAMNELSNHDHSRFLTRTNHIVGRAEHVGAKAARKESTVRYERSGDSSDDMGRSSDDLLRRRSGLVWVYRSGQ